MLAIVDYENEAADFEEVERRREAERRFAELIDAIADAA
jgi:hypothetical protein